MHVKVETDSSLKNNEIIIKANKANGELAQIINLLNSIDENKIPAFRDKEIFFINVKDIEYFYTENKKVFIDFKTGKYEIKYKIYELEEKFCAERFVKIEQGVIANTDKIKNIKMLFNGTMQITFLSGNVQYASRRCVSQIKKRLGI